MKPEIRGADLKVRGLSKTFGKQQVLQNLDLTISPGEFIAVVGRSGCGKSTLLRLLAGLESPTTGNILIDGEPLKQINHSARVMFQDARLLLWRRVLENVGLGLRHNYQAKAQWAIEMQRLISSLWQEQKFTALLITHDVEEAVALADRVVLIEAGKVAMALEITLSRPRHRGDAASAAIVEHIYERVLNPGSTSETSLLTRSY